MALVVALLSISMLVIKGSCLGPAPRNTKTKQVSGDAASLFTSNGDAVNASTNPSNIPTAETPVSDMIGTCECKWAKKPNGCNIPAYTTHCQRACCKAKQNRKVTSMPTQIQDEGSDKKTETNDKTSDNEAEFEDEISDNDVKSGIHLNADKIEGEKLERESVAIQNLAIKVDRKALEVKEQAEKARMRTQELDFAADQADVEFQNLQAKSLRLSDQARKLNKKAELLDKQADVLIKGGMCECNVINKVKWCNTQHHKSTCHQACCAMQHKTKKILVD